MRLQIKKNIPRDVLLLMVLSSVTSFFVLVVIALVLAVLSGPLLGVAVAVHILVPPHPDLQQKMIIY